MLRKSDAGRQVRINSVDDEQIYGYRQTQYDTILAAFRVDVEVMGRGGA